MALCDSHYQFLCLIRAPLQLTAIFVPSPRVSLSCQVPNPDAQVQSTRAAACSQGAELLRQGSWWGRCLLGVVVACVGSLPTAQHKHVKNHNQCSNAREANTSGLLLHGAECNTTVAYGGSLSVIATLTNQHYVQKDKQGMTGLQSTLAPCSTGAVTKAAAKRELRKGSVSTLTLQTSILKPFEKNSFSRVKSGNFTIWSCFTSESGTHPGSATDAGCP